MKLLNEIVRWIVCYVILSICEWMKYSDYHITLTMWCDRNLARHLITPSLASMPILKHGNSLSLSQWLAFCDSHFPTASELSARLISVTWVWHSWWSHWWRHCFISHSDSHPALFCLFTMPCAIHYNFILNTQVQTAEFRKLHSTVTMANHESQTHHQS